MITPAIQDSPSTTSLLSAWELLPRRCENIFKIFRNPRYQRRCLRIRTPSQRAQYQVIRRAVARLTRDRQIVAASVHYQDQDHDPVLAHHLGRSPGQD